MMPRVSAPTPRRRSTRRRPPPHIGRLPVEPEVLEARAVVDAVDHVYDALHLRLPAGSDAPVENDRSGIVFDQLPFNLPHQAPALARVGLTRLSLDQPVDLLVTVAGVVSLRPAHVILGERRVGIVDLVLGYIQTDVVVLPHQLRIPLRGVEWIELGVDVDLL